jgi:hypothetical protein
VHRENIPHILSRPLKVEWAGWFTDTYKLQAAGWQISAEQDVFGGYMRLAMMHEGLQMRALSDTIVFDYHMARERWYEYLPTIRFRMLSVGREIRIHHQERAFADFGPIDAKPTFTTTTISRMEDLVHFAAPMVRTRQIIIPDESVPELMERILKLQQPARTDRIREEMRNPEGLRLDAIPQQKFHAQIISLAA